MTDASTITYTVQPWDTLSAIAGAIGTTTADLRRVNGLGRAGIETGQTLTLRPPIRERLPALKLIPDSELVNSPTAAQFDMAAFMAQYPNAYLSKYTQRFDGQTMRGPRIVERVAQELSVHPRLLLALLEYHAGWLTNPNPTGEKLRYPLGAHGSDRQTLDRQLSWACARLNEGYYGWRLANRLWIEFTDNSRAYVSDQTNAGSAGLQNYLAAISTRQAWATATVGVINTYQKLFGDPWKNDLGQLVPDDLQQPEMYLPWEIGQTWLLTGGPHAAWGVGSPWAALDFTTIDGRGCGTLRGWVTAVAEGTITRSVDGEVAQALDPSGDERKGWSVFYMHVGTSGRAKLGMLIGTGEPIGHPSCEGGYSEGSHLHIARKYNGEWIDAGGNIPFVMSGWVAAGGELEYDGAMIQGEMSRTPCECRDVTINGISH
jgi:LasA protease